MNAEETVAKLRKRYDVNLPSGLSVTIRLPKIRDCILAGNVPLPVLQHIQKRITESNGDEPETSLEEARQMAAFHDELVMRTLVAIEGEPVTMTQEAVAEIEQGDYQALLAYAQRTKSPLAAQPA